MVLWRGIKTYCFSIKNINIKKDLDPKTTPQIYKKKPFTTSLDNIRRPFQASSVFEYLTSQILKSRILKSLFLRAAHRPPQAATSRHRPENLLALPGGLPPDFTVFCDLTFYFILKPIVGPLWTFIFPRNLENYGSKAACRGLTKLVRKEMRFWSVLNLEK